MGEKRETDCRTGNVGHGCTMTFLGGAAVNRRRHTWVPPYRGMVGGAVQKEYGLPRRSAPRNDRV